MRQFHLICGLVAALLLNGVAFSATTVQVDASVNPAAAGQPVTFTATVTTTSMAANPTVTFSINGSPGAAVPVTNGVATSASATLPVGTHTVSATFSGDSTVGTLAGGLVVRQATTTVVVESSNNPQLLGQSVTFTARVTAEFSQQPSGSIEFKNGSMSLGFTLITNGLATFTTTFPLGTYPISAAFVGSTELAPSVGSLAANQQFVLGTTTTTVTSSSNPIFAGQTVQFMAVVTSNFGTVLGGTISFFDNGNLLSSPPMNGNTAISPPISLTPGVHTITAIFAPSGPFSQSVGTLTGGQIVNLVNSTTTLNTTKSPAGAFETVVLTASVTSPIGVPTAGGVQFSINNNLFGGPVALSNGKASISLNSIGGILGNQAITATFVPTVIHGASTGALTQVFTPQPAIMTVTSSLNPSVAGQTISYSVKVVAGGATISGGVDFVIDGGAPISVPVFMTSGTATITPPVFSTTGIHSITATFVPGTQFLQSTTGALPGGQQVNAASLSTTITAAINPGLVGQALSYVAVVDSPSVSPTGTVQFSVDGINLGAPATLANGQAVSPLISTLSVGSHNVVAFYMGNAGSSTSAPLVQVLNKATTTVAVTSNNNPAKLGDTVTFTATVTPQPSGTPTGTVTFYNGTSALGVATLAANGIATLTTPPLPTNAVSTGNLPVTAVYSGDASYNASTSPVMLQTVLGKVTTTVAVKSDKNPASLGDSVTITATVTPAANGTPTGSVTFYNGTSALGIVALGANATATLITPPLPTLAISAGNLPLTAVYSGDTNHTGSTSPVMLQTVLKGITVLKWEPPANIFFPTPLSGTQLNATANTPGSFVYTPASGTVLQPGSNQQLSVEFVPDDAVNFSAAAKTVTINVLQATITVVSPPAAMPNPAFVNSLVRINAVVTSLAPLTLSWDFGDGSIDATNSASVTHKYAAAGTYTVVLTIKDSAGQTVTRPLQLIVNAPVLGDGGVLDSDGDGFADSLETLMKTDPTDNLSKPVTTGADSLTVNRVKITLNFATPGTRNAVMVSGKIPVSAAPTQQLSIDVSGVTRTFQLDGSGVGRQGKDTFFYDARTSLFTLKLANGAFETPLAAAGLTEKQTVTKSPRTIAVTILSNQTVLKGTANVLFSAKAGKSGSAQ